MINGTITRQGESRKFVWQISLQDNDIKVVVETGLYYQHPKAQVIHFGPTGFYSPKTIVMAAEFDSKMMALSKLAEKQVREYLMDQEYAKVQAAMKKEQDREQELQKISNLLQSECDILEMIK